MIPSIRGHLLPESEADFQSLLKRNAAMYPICFDCERDFTGETVKSAAGWRETQISGFCELCYDKLFADAEDSGVDQL